jgi:hypothetical protein
MAEHQLPIGELFFDAYRPEIEQVFKVVGLPDDVTSSLGRAVELTQPWVGGDHSRPNHVFNLDEQQRAELKALFVDLDMAEERPLPDDHYDQIIVLGGIQAGNLRRTDFLKRMLDKKGVTTDKVVLLGGQRRIYVERETDDINANFAELFYQEAHTEWSEHFKADMLAEQGETRWETDLIRLAAMAKIGPLVFKRLQLRLGNEDFIGRYEFDWNNLSVDLLHTLAVPRPNGESRHTTEACIGDWIETYQPKDGARVGMVNANPHIDRMIRSARSVATSLGRSDIELIPAGPTAPLGIRESIFLGEIARNLYEDQRTANARQS